MYRKYGSCMYRNKLAALSPYSSTNEEIKNPKSARERQVWSGVCGTGKFTCVTPGFAALQLEEFFYVRVTSFAPQPMRNFSLAQPFFWTSSLSLSQQGGLFVVGLKDKT